MNKKNTYLLLAMLIIIPIAGIAFGQTILDFIVTPTISSATESISLVTPVSQTATPDPVIVNGSSIPTNTTATESISLVTPVSQTATPDPVIVNGSSIPTNTTATESVSVVNPTIFTQTPTVSPITKTMFASVGTSFVPQPEPVITSSIITKSNFTSIGTFFVPQPEPVITTTVITKSTFQSVGTITTAQPSHNFCDLVPITGDWIVQSGCTLSLNSSVNGSGMIQNSSLLIIPSGVALTVPSGENFIIQNESGVLIKSGGSLKIIGPPDSDSDGTPDVSDNCPITPNADQLDTDVDGMGDACDTDDDNDTIVDGSDNCSLIANLNQNDLDSDGTGDLCDSETLITSNTILTEDTTLAGDLGVEPGFVLTINPGVTLDIDFVNHKIFVKFGGGILIKSGGTIN